MSRRWWGLGLLGVLALAGWQGSAWAASPTSTFQGVFWQPDCHSGPRLTDYRPLGAEFVVLQWTAVEGETFSGQGASACRLDWLEVQRQTGGLPLLLGLQGAYHPQRADLPELARQSNLLARQLLELPFDPPPLGYYAPLEVNPMWPADAVRSYLNALPRPLWVSAYLGPGQASADLLPWLERALPQDVHLMFQDGVGAHGANPFQVAALLRELRAARQGGVSVIMEVFRPMPLGGRYRSALPWELEAQFRAYGDFQRVAFDGGHYLSRAWVQFYQFLQRLHRPAPGEHPEESRARRALPWRTSA